MQIRDLMSRYVEVVAHNTAVREAAMKMRDLKVTMLPVCDGPLLAGIITIRDIALRLAAEGYDAMLTEVGEIMTRDLTFCFEDQPLEEAAMIMESYQIDRLPVLDRNRRLVGIISLSDIAAHERQQHSAPAAPELTAVPSQYSAAMVAAPKQR